MSIIILSVCFRCAGVARALRSNCVADAFMCLLISVYLPFIYGCQG